MKHVVIMQVRQQEIRIPKTLNPLDSEAEVVDITPPETNDNYFGFTVSEITSTAFSPPSYIKKGLSVSLDVIFIPHFNNR